jgi:hypothetical protein
MAKKPKKKAEAAKETKSDASGDAKAPLPALPSDMIAVKRKNVDHIEAIRRKEIESEAAHARVDSLKEEMKIARAEAKRLDIEVRSMIRNGPNNPSLFDKHDTPEAPAMETGPDGETKLSWDASPYGDALDTKSDPVSDWATPSLREILKKPGDRTFTKALGMLAKVEIVTAGDLEKLRAEHGNDWYHKIPGLGTVGRDEITELFDAYLQRTRDAGEFAKAGPRAAIEFGWDQKFDVVRYIQDSSEFKAGVTPAKIKKQISGTREKAERLDAVWSCDDDGVRVEIFRGQAVPADRCLITYAEACDMIKGLVGKPKQAAAAAPSGEPRVAEMVKYLIERFGIDQPLDAEEIRERYCPGSGSAKGMQYEFSGEGLQVHIPEQERGIVLQYAELAELVKARLAEMT